MKKASGLLVRPELIIGFSGMRGLHVGIGRIGCITGLPPALNRGRRGRHGGLIVSAHDSRASALGSGFEPWPGTLCCVLGQEDTLLSRCLSPPRCINGTGEFNAGGNPAMD